MNTITLGSSTLEVSRFALGTMAFGARNDRESACALLDCAIEHGINLIDTAEMYPAPATAAKYGESERILGYWLQGRGRRDDVILATKVAGPGGFVPWIRAGESTHDADHLETALAGSLLRLQTDYIDLLQLHWPDRAANYFGQLGFKPARNERPFDLERTLRALSALVNSGRVRAIGVCNETPWGVMEFIRLARAHGLREIASVQNPYNLLNRGLEVGLAEVAWREGCGMLTYSPLASGTLTGKYLADRAGAGARRLGHPRIHRHRHRLHTDAAERAVRRYVELAHAYALTPAQMALAWVASKPWVSSVIIGATDREQLTHNLAARETVLPRALEKAIDVVHQEISNPCP